MGAAVMALQILVGGGMATLWDDETFLGRGPAIGAGVSAPITRGLSVEGEANWSALHRDSGYLAADSRLLSATGRLSFAFRDRSKRVRPFVSAGATWLRSTGHFTRTIIVAGPDFRPMNAGTERQDWKPTSLVGWEVGTGAEIRASSRLTIRPEVRWTFTASDPTFRPGELEPPLMGPRVGITLLWSAR